MVLRTGDPATTEKRWRVERTSWWARNQRSVIPYIFIAPNLVVFSVFMFYPILYAVYISFHSWSLIGTPEFIGTDNYVQMAKDPQFWRALRNTVVYAAGTVPSSIALGLAVALLLNRNLPFRTLLRSVFFLPVIISGVVTALIAGWIFNESYGIANAILTSVGLDRIHWLSSPTWAMPTVIITTLWIRVGFNMVVYLAGLQSIPRLYYEAAQIDGASGWRQFRDVTWPLLAPTTFFLLVMNVIYSFQAFDLIFVMTGGGPGFSTTLLVVYIFQAAFQTSEMGYASAMGIVLFVLMLVFTIVQWRISRQGGAE